MMRDFYLQGVSWNMHIIDSLSVLSFSAFYSTHWSTVWWSHVSVTVQKWQKHLMEQISRDGVLLAHTACLSAISSNEKEIQNEDLVDNECRICIILNQLGTKWECCCSKQCRTVSTWNNLALMSDLFQQACYNLMGITPPGPASYLQLLQSPLLFSTSRNLISFILTLNGRMSLLLGYVVL